MPKQFATPGNRTLYREVLESRSLSRCGVLANALWPRLLLLVDDQGRLAGGTSEILTGAFPRMLAAVTFADVEAALAELEREQMVVRYQVKGDDYLQLRDWWRWNRSMRRMLPSRFPAPPKWRDAVYGIKGAPDSFDTFVHTVGDPGPVASVKRPSRRHESVSSPRETMPDGDRANGHDAAAEPDPAAAPPRAQAPAGAQSRAEPERRGATARARARTATRSRSNGSGAGIPHLGIQADDDRYPVAVLLATRFGWTSCSAVEWDAFAEEVDVEFPIGTAKGADRKAAWQWLHDELEQCPRDVDDPKRWFFERRQAVKRERLEDADADERAWEITRARYADEAGPIAAELADRIGAEASTNGHVPRQVSREATLEMLRSVRGTLEGERWERLLARYGVDESELASA